MAIDFLSCEGKIELNQKRLDTYNEGLEKATARISFVSIIYSILSIYLVQLINYTIEHTFQNIVFIIFLSLFLALLIASIIWTIKLLLPVKIAHVHEPKYFYGVIRKKYEELAAESKEKKVLTNEELQQKISLTYLSELEKAVDTNYKAYKSKRRNFYYAFNFALLALIPYLVCSAIILATLSKQDEQQIRISNADELLHKIDSLVSKHKR